MWLAFCNYILSLLPLPLTRDHFVTIYFPYFHFHLHVQYWFLLVLLLLYPFTRDRLFSPAYDRLYQFAHDQLFSPACDRLYQFAYDQWFLPARDYVLAKLGINNIRDLPNDNIVDKLKHELEIIEESIHRADKVADAEGDDQSHGTREKIKQLIERFFRIQDDIDEYIILEEQQLPDPECAAGVNFVKKNALHFRILNNIQIIKSKLDEIKDTSSELDHEGSSSSNTNRNATLLLQNIRKAPFYMKEGDVVGFEKPKDILVNWLVEGRDVRTVVAVVAMGGQGKTTLAKQVFDQVKGDFDYHVWITVSKPYNIQKVLRELLKEDASPPQNSHELNKDSLVEKVRNYLQDKRYVVVFDDVWDSLFWADILFAMSDEQKGCRILITTRSIDVANSFRDSSFVEIHKLKGLDDKQSLDLFNKKAFYGDVCPPNLIDISSKIVEQCAGSPLAIVVIASFLSGKKRNPIEWSKVNDKIRPKLKKDFVMNQILVLSYHDLPYNLKSCLLYFGMYPEDSNVNSERLIRKWIAEGFVKEEEGMTLEEIAEEYLTELIHRCLVQVVSFNLIDGRAGQCCVHDLVHDLILKKSEDLSFCKNISEHGQSALNGVVRRLSITTNSGNLMESIKSSQVRSLVVPNPYTLPESFANQIIREYRLLKVFDAKVHGFLEVPEDFGSLNHLRYFSIKTTTHNGGCTRFPNSIGMRMPENLETLDFEGTVILGFPKEICKLKKLRHYLRKRLDLVELKDGIGEMTSLQTLRVARIQGYDNRVIEVIEELGKLKQLKELGLENVMEYQMSVLSSSINKMQQLEKLSIKPSYGHIIDLNLNLPKLQYLVLRGKLEKLPEWIEKLENLVELQLELSKLTEDSMKLLGSMPNLLSISLSLGDYAGETVHFENEWFKNLKELYLYGFENIVIDQGALPSLERWTIRSHYKVKRLPTGIQHLKKLQYLDFDRVTVEFMDNILVNGGKDHWIFKQVPFVRIYDAELRELST